jgi:hypothetical protein
MIRAGAGGIIFMLFPYDEGRMLLARQLIQPDASTAQPINVRTLLTVHAFRETLPLEG